MQVFRVCGGVEGSMYWVTLGLLQLFRGLTGAESMAYFEVTAVIRIYFFLTYWWHFPSLIGSKISFQAKYKSIRNSQFIFVIIPPVRITYHFSVRGLYV